MRFASLGSGSRGNATLVQSRAATLMVDCGFGIRETLRRLAALEVAPERIDAILITHEHGDHSRGALPLARKYGIPIFATWGTAQAARLADHPRLRPIHGDSCFAIGDIGVEAVRVHHDAREPCQFVFSAAGLRLGVLTDTGHITPHVRASYQGCDGLLLEMNHDPRDAANGPVSAEPQAAVGGDYGHLSNVQSLDLLESVYHPNLKQLVLAHLSETNNCPQLVADAVGPRIDGNATEMTVAAQDAIVEWLEVSGAGRRPV